MSKIEKKSVNNEPDLEAVRGWVEELDAQIKENEKLLDECRGQKEGSFKNELKEKLTAELIEQRHTRFEYAKLYREEKLKQNKQEPEL